MKIIYPRTSKDSFSYVHPLNIYLLAIVIVLILFAHSTSAESDVLRIDKKWTGDFDGMVERRLVRVLVTYNMTNYFLDKGAQRGATYEALTAFEKHINEKLKNKHLQLHVAFIPVTRDNLIPALIEGRGDVAAASLTITPERQQQVDFTDPLATGVREVVVASPNAPALKSIDDLSGKEIHVRKTSSYFESLSRLNQEFKKAGKKPVNVKEASELLESEDLLEMVNAGLLPMIVVDDYLAGFWSQIFTDMVTYNDIYVNEGAEIAWMIRKNSPELKTALNEFIKENKKGSQFGNVVLKRYFENTKWVRNAMAGEDMDRFKNTAAIFQKYADKYDLPWLLLAAVGYQESRLDQSVRSPAGAVGVMQLLPSTAAGDPVNIANVEKIENNIHAGTKYLRFLHDRYYKEEPMDKLNKALFTFASYNAGPAKISKLRARAAEQGFDPNLWFANVEVMAAEAIGSETVKYVSNIYKYYVAYLLLWEQKELKEKVKDSSS
jgi:membrane-bound lytic murein transglycosylase MltF